MSQPDLQTPAPVELDLQPSAPAQEESVDYRAHQVGHIASCDDDGRVQVVFPGNMLVPVPARSTLAHPLDSCVGASVLLVFENADPLRPIVVGLLQNEIASAPSEGVEELQDVVVDGRHVHFEGAESITLRCGKSTLQLRRDGKILIRGTHILSRSSGPNRIKGASINLN